MSAGFFSTMDRVPRLPRRVSASIQPFTGHGRISERCAMRTTSTNPYGLVYVRGEVSVFEKTKENLEDHLGLRHLPRA